MFKDCQAFSGILVDNQEAAQHFYTDVLGLEVVDTGMGLKVMISGRTPLYVYEKTDHVPATYTVLNFPVKDIDEAVAYLSANGVLFEHYNGLTDEQGVARGKSVGRGPDIAWFKDPAGNILSVLCE